MDNKSPHILNTSANLLGFMFIILTSIKSLGLSRSGVTDEITGLCVILFAFSTLMSFMSMRTVDPDRLQKFEYIADIVFLIGLVLCMLLSVLLVLDVVKIGK